MVDAPDDPLLYRQLMAVKPAQMSLNQWLVSAGVNRSFFTDLRRTGNARITTLEKLVEAAGVSMAEFHARDTPSTRMADRREEYRAQDMPFRRDDERRDVPMLGTALGADYEIGADGQQRFAEVTELDEGEIIDHLRRPPALAKRTHVYGLTIVGSSMSPRFDPGDPVYVDPKQTPRIGDDVVVYLRQRDGDGERIYSALVKRLVKRGSAFVELEQHLPAVAFQIATRDVVKIDRIIPWREMVSF